MVYQPANLTASVTRAAIPTQWAAQAALNFQAEREARRAAQWAQAMLGPARIFTIAAECEAEAATRAASSNLPDYGMSAGWTGRLADDASRWTAGDVYTALDSTGALSRFPARVRGWLTLSLEEAARIGALA